MEYLCHCDLDENQDPDECVFNHGDLDDCIFTIQYRSATECPYAKPKSPYTDDQLRLAILYHTKLMEFLRNQTLNGQLKYLNFDANAAFCKVKEFAETELLPSKFME